MPGIKLTLESPHAGGGDPVLMNPDDTTPLWTPMGTTADPSNRDRQAGNVLVVGDYVAGSRYSPAMKIKLIESWTPDPDPSE